MLKYSNLIKLLNKKNSPSYSQKNRDGHTSEMLHSAQ